MHDSLRRAAPSLTASGARDDSSPLAMGAAQQTPRTRPPIVSSRPIAGGSRFPALALTNDVGVVTAIGNDVGFDHVFSRQVIAFGGVNDVALGFSTSGASRNVVAAMVEARSRGLLTIAMSGGDGGRARTLGGG